MNTNQENTPEMEKEISEIQNQVMQKPILNKVNSILDIVKDNPTISNQAKTTVDIVISTARKMHENLATSRKLMNRVRYISDGLSVCHEKTTQKEETKESFFKKQKRKLANAGFIGKVLYKTSDFVEDTLNKDIINSLREGELEKLIDDINNFGKNVGKEYEELLVGKELLIELLKKAELSLENLQKIENPDERILKEIEELFTNIQILKSNLKSINHQINTYKESVLKNIEDSRYTVIYLLNTVLSGTISQATQNVVKTNELMRKIQNDAILIPHEQALESSKKLTKLEEGPQIADETLQRIIDIQGEFKKEEQKRESLKKAKVGNNSSLLLQLQQLNNEGNTKKITE